MVTHQALFWLSPDIYSQDQLTENSTFETKLHAYLVRKYQTLITSPIIMITCFPKYFAIMIVLNHYCLKRRNLVLLNDMYVTCMIR